jgi:pyrrolidone-carboxylate peptidase
MFVTLVTGSRLEALVMRLARFSSVTALARVIATVCVVLSGVLVAAPASARTTSGCADGSVTLTVEEARLGTPVPGGTASAPAELIRRGNLEPLVHAFTRGLCAVPSRNLAEGYAEATGRLLFESAVARAQRSLSIGAALPADDDRPLYWTRLALTRALRQWTPAFPHTAADRAAWEKRLEYASRGLTSSTFRPEPGARKLMISGFDPFQLDAEIRRGNPSGAVALALDGRVLTALDGTRVQVQAVIFPVRYPDFDRGIVEDAYRPALARRPDQVATISQGRLGAFDLEAYNGRRRSALAGDNLNLWGGGTLAAPVVFPNVGPGAEFLPSTLPLEAMSAAAGLFPVRINTTVREIPAGSTIPVVRTDGPTPGSIASEGGGGGYLSNESAYRVTRLLTETPSAPPGGHVHTPVLSFDPANATELSDPVFEANRAAIIEQTAAILLAGLASSPAA